MTATAFITLSECKGFLDPNYPSTDSAQDALLTATLSAVCEAIEEYLKRPVVARSISATFDGGTSILFLKPQVFSITSVVEDGTTLVASDYALYPEEGYIVRMSGDSDSTWESGRRTVVITYTAGVAGTVDGVPANIKLAAKIGVKFFMKSGPEDYGARLGEGVFIRPDRFPQQALWLLSPFRAVSVG